MAVPDWIEAGKRFGCTPVPAMRAGRYLARGSRTAQLRWAGLGLAGEAVGILAAGEGRAVAQPRASVVSRTVAKTS